MTYRHSKLVAGLGASFLLLLPGCLRGPVPLAARCPKYAPSTACPFGAHGVRVATTETDNGVDVALAAGPGGIEDLRNRAHYAIEGVTEPGMALPTHTTKVAPLSVKSHVEVRDTTSGVDIRVSALDPEQADDLRDEVYARLDRAADPSVCN